MSSSSDRSGGAEPNYRPEVDGLRAVAVLVVVLFHVAVPGFAGGYVGVDVFFVISGFLITRLILGELESGRFRFGRFYGRRARRIAPALLATLTATLVAGVVILSPFDLERLSESLVYTIVSLSNVLFWRESGYFDSTSDRKPLLHTWSLGVEEQFYLFWPLAVWLAFRWRGRRGVIGLAAAVAAASLVAAEWGAGKMPVAIFFLTPFRICELLLGALLLAPAEARSGNRRGAATMTIAGLSAIGYSVAAFTSSHRFPGLAAMVPCGGAALVIFGGPNRVARLLLANRAAVAIGKLSYSLYLVHWPIIAFVRYGTIDEWSPIKRVAVIAISFAAAIALHLGIERPLHQGRAGPRRLGDSAFGLACAGVALVLVLPAVAALTAHGWPERMPERIRLAMASIVDFKQTAPITYEQTEVPSAKALSGGAARPAGLVVGDSHGHDLLVALAAAGSELRFRHLKIEFPCQPVLARSPSGDGTPFKTRELAETCDRRSEEVLSDPLLLDAPVIFLASAWSEFGLAALPETLETLKSRYSGRIVVSGGRPRFTEPIALLTRTATLEEANRRFDAARRIDREEMFGSELRRIARQAGVDFLDLRPTACDARGSGWFCPLLLDDGTPLYWDSHHWTNAGAGRVGERLRADASLTFLD